MCTEIQNCKTWCTWRLNVDFCDARMKKNINYVNDNNNNGKKIIKNKLIFDTPLV